MSVLIYQMGRVGSVAVNKTLKAAGVNTFHAHYLVNGGEHYKRNLDAETINELRHYDIVTLVRDPIARNFSEYFRRMSPKIEYDYNWLYKVFMREFNHVWPLMWFDLEFKPWTGIDLLEKKFHAYSSTNFYSLDDGREVLVIRTDRLSTLQVSAALSDLTQKEIPVVEKYNSTGDRPGLNELYDQFRSDVCLPEPYVDFMYNTRYSTTFFSDRERDLLKDKWICKS